MTILRDSYLRKVGENEFSRSKLEVSTRYSVEDDIVVTIPKGEKVHIYKVTQYLQHAVNGGEYVIAFGRYTSPKGQSYRFQFVWGVSGNLYLAPWVESKYSQGEYW